MIINNFFLIYREIVQNKIIFPLSDKTEQSLLQKCCFLGVTNIKFSFRGGKK